MLKNTKYALYKYSTHNIGDEIQSIAARQFLPKVDYFIDRDSSGDWINPNQNESVKLIANGWYLHNPMKWPITDKTITPLLTSIHINDTDKRVTDVFASDDSMTYLKYFSEIGARDKTTQKIFIDLGLKSNFSACMTLTLEKDPNIKKEDYIVCVTTSDEVYNMVKSKTDRPVIKIDTTTFDEEMESDSKFNLAEQYLYLYQSAHLVITTRLHAMLPCLALETPVLHINNSGATTYDPSRLDGLMELTNNISEEDFLKNIDKIDFERPKNNPKGYLIYRKKLTKLCEDFIGHKKASSFAVSNDFTNFKFADSELFKTILFNYDKEKNIKDYLLYLRDQEINNLKSEIEQLNSVKQSAYKLTNNIKRKIKG